MIPDNKKHDEHIHVPDLYALPPLFSVNGTAFVVGGGSIYKRNDETWPAFRARVEDAYRNRRDYLSLPELLRTIAVLDLHIAETDEAVSRFLAGNSGDTPIETDFRKEVLSPPKKKDEI